MYEQKNHKCKRHPDEFNKSMPWKNYNEKKFTLKKPQYKKKDAKKVPQKSPLMSMINLFLPKICV